jgi:hypothetical protein
MSATDELIQNVYEFRGLLRYLGERYPQILNEWNNSRGLNQSPTADADVNNPGQGKAYERR